MGGGGKEWGKGGEERRGVRIVRVRVDGLGSFEEERREGEVEGEEGKYDFRGPHFLSLCPRFLLAALSLAASSTWNACSCSSVQM